MLHEYTLTHDVYSPRAIDRAVQDFSHLCLATISVGQNATTLKISSRGAEPSVIDEFLNYTLELSVQELFG